MEDLRRVRDVSNINFEETFPVIKETIESATFVAFDAEFTGIAAADAKQNSLFDTPKERYATMRNNLKDFIISQFGLTTFQFDREANKYVATTFVFYLFPRSVGTLHRKFNAETSAFQFLAQYSFDFSKFMGSGVTYLRRSDEGALSTERPWLASAMRSRRNGPMGRARPALSRAERGQIQDEVTRLVEWLARGRCQAEPLAGLLRSDNPRLMDRLGHVVRKAFRGVTITTTYDKVARQWSNVYHDMGPNLGPFRDRLANDKAGFCRVFRLLSELKKPVVGHNAILDLMLMYNQFHAPLPEDYAVFKREMHSLFPHVFDTKFLSYELRDCLSRGAVWESNDLAKLYLYFESENGSFLAKYSPLIQLAPGSEIRNAFHEAGWDSYCTGYCFVRIMHFFATRDNEGCGMDAKALTSVQHLFSVEQYKNRINVSRANINSINLAGADPISQRPQWMVLEAIDRKATKFCNFGDVVARSTDLSLDVKHLSPTQALIAVNSAGSARIVTQAFAGNKEFSVSSYNPLKHNRTVRRCLWAGIVSSGAVVATLLMLGKRG